MTGLLDGMRVLDAGIWRPVPHATQMLADLGADVCKLEPPGGDPMRMFPDLFADIASHKRASSSTCAATRAERARSSSPRGPTCSAKGGGPASPTGSASATTTVREVNPSIIYCSISGYGQTGPLVDRVGHDVNYQALAGAIAPRGDETPAIPHVPIADLAAGTVAALLICAAWAKRVQTGEGERIDVAMADVGRGVGRPARR